MRQVIVIAMFAALAACNSGHRLGEIDPTIGATCSNDRNCDDRCYLGGEFPGGFCSLSCLSDRDCPVDTYCIDTQGGVCMYICPDFDCTRLGAGWSCKDKDRAGGGKASVCSG
jgi:hypothetical protein